jgi:hypothetical protein
VTLPWWDWSKTAGIQSAYSSAEADGAANVLAKAPVKPFDATRKAGWPTETSRAPGEVPQTPGESLQTDPAMKVRATLDVHHLGARPS